MAEKELYSFALNNFLDELLRVCPEIQKAFFFIDEDEILAGMEEASGNISALVLSAFKGVFEKSEILGGVERVTVEANSGAVRLFRYGHYYFVMVNSAKADTQFLNILTRVLIPTVLKLLDRISPTPLRSQPQPTHETLQPETPQSNETSEFLSQDKPEEEFKPENAPETQPEHPLPPEPFAVQLIVENVGGFLSKDAVRIDMDALSRWQETFSGKKIDYVKIETIHGRTVNCKVKPLKDPVFQGRSIIQIPEKIQRSLKIKRGELVTVKPIIE